MIRTLKIHDAVERDDRDFTLETLTKANPDVIICSDPAGFVALQQTHEQTSKTQ